ncbi:MAG: MBL fold metallo-hydrolase [Akkermansiaceae bacterium]|nr:MBL fold metallo-hydrolase [Akkermansiaceae bacterium]
MSPSLISVWDSLCTPSLPALGWGVPDEILSLEGGYLLTRSYLIPTQDGGHLMIDAPMDADVWLEQLGIVPQALLLTHQHFDHVMTASKIAKSGVPIYAWQPFSRELTLEEVVRSWGMPFDVDAYEVTHLLAAEKSLSLGGLDFELLHVPGHSVDSVVFHLPAGGLAFAGDTLFAGSTGRADLPGGDMELLLSGIRTKLYTLPENTRIHPGHGPATTIGTERRQNAVVRP